MASGNKNAGNSQQNARRERDNIFTNFGLVMQMRL
jgi:hypothetical protein